MVLKKTSEPGKYTACESWGPSRAAPPTLGEDGLRPEESDPLILLSPLVSQIALQTQTPDPKY